MGVRHPRRSGDSGIGAVLCALVAMVAAGALMVGCTVPATPGSGASTDTGRTPIAPPAPSVERDPYAAPLDVDPHASVRRAVAQDADASGRSEAESRLLARITSQPLATWITEPETQVRSRVHEIVAGAASRGAVPVLVAYDIPDRDCGGYSAGGADAAAYRTWVDEFARGLSAGPAIVVVEPDALAQLDCLDTAARQERLALLAHAVDRFADAGAWVYLDAGHSGWAPVDEIAQRLVEAGLAKARGFSLNVANFRTTEEEIAYGTAIAQATGTDAHFVIDTSRNGVAPTDRAWCNPPGRGLGSPPTTITASALVDAYLWIKTPGRSDGSCEGGPPAGDWWPQYAVGLAERASSA